jgi:hypothetical protein
MVYSKNGTASLMINKSRLYTGESISEIQDKFMKRKQEMHYLLLICDKIKKYIVDNKANLLKRKNIDDKQKQEIRIVRRKRQGLVVRENSINSNSFVSNEVTVFKRRIPCRT